MAWVWKDWCKKKKDANLKVANLKKRGYKTRIVKSQGGYAIYIVYP